jgi:hypothetical protein
MSFSVGTPAVTGAGESNDDDDDDDKEGWKGRESSGTHYFVTCHLHYSPIQFLFSLFRDGVSYRSASSSKRTTIIKMPISFYSYIAVCNIEQKVS